MDELAFLFALHVGAQYTQISASQLDAFGPRLELEMLARPEFWFELGPVGAYATAHADSLDGWDNDATFLSVGMRALVRPLPQMFFGVTLWDTWQRTTYDGIAWAHVRAPEFVVGGNLGWIGRTHVQLVATAASFDANGQVRQVGLQIGLQRAVH